ncbi:MAG TPA: HEAT repeat domain-containing protein [Pirellulales bacterium]|nr:HEAT repeat domain-containing protein [Pirellulales bacterium]
MRRSWIQVATTFLLALSAVLPAAARAADDELVEQIVKLLADPDREFRAAALEQVRGSARGEAQTKTFAAQLPKLEPSAQAALVTALADRGDSAARPAIVGLLAASQDEQVRSAALAALGEIGTVDDLPILVHALSASSSAERRSARTALVRMRGDSVIKSIAAEVQPPPPATKTTLVEVLSTRRATDAMPVFLTASLDDDGQVRRAAMNALGQLAGPDQLAAMIQAVLKAEKGFERDAAERNVAAVCGRIGNEDERADALIAAIDKVDAAQRDELLSLVGRVGGKRLIDFVGDIATGEDMGRRLLAIDALSKWPDASPADKLLEISNKTTDAAEREQAFQGYVKLAAARDGRPDKERLDRMKQAMEAARTPEERSLVINRCRTAYSVDSMRFVLPYLAKPEFAQVACETIVELAHHREVRDPNKKEFDAALDEVIKLSSDPVVVDRAQRYKRGETWTRPKK